MSAAQTTALDVADHLLRSIDDAIPTNPTPEELNRLAAASGLSLRMMTSYMPGSLTQVTFGLPR